MVDKSISIKFWDFQNSAFISVFITKRHDVFELKICGEYEDKNGITVHERCMTTYLITDNIKELLELLKKVIK